MSKPMINAESIFCNLIGAEIEEKDPDPNFLTENYEGEFTENAKAVAEVALAKNYIEEGSGRVQEAVVVAVSRLRDFELHNGDQAAREAGLSDEENVPEAACDDAAYWKGVALWMADAHAENFQIVQQGRTSKREQERLKSTLLTCLSALRGHLVEPSYRRDAYDVIQRLFDVAKRLS